VNHSLKSFEELPFLVNLSITYFKTNFSVLLFLIEIDLLESSESLEIDLFGPLLSSSSAEDFLSLDFFRVGIDVIKAVHLVSAVRLYLDVPKGFPELVARLLPIETDLLLDAHIVFGLQFNFRAQT
jgi:hypothetical protein